MEKESARNGKEYMIMMSTMIWVMLTRTLVWLVLLLEDLAPSLTLEGGEPAGKQLVKVINFTIDINKIKGYAKKTTYSGTNVC